MTEGLVSDGSEVFSKGLASLDLGVRTGGHQLH